MSTKTQNNALESAELGAKVDAIVQIVQEMAQEKPTSVNAYGLSTWTKAKKLITDLVKSYSAPVAAQPDLTQQTLDDVMAGIPARDAEIEALRKEIEALQAALAQPQRLIFPTILRKMWSGSEVQAWLDDELAKLTKLSSQQVTDKTDAGHGYNDGFSDGVILALQLMTMHGDYNGTQYCELFNAAGPNQIVERAIREGMWEMSGLSQTPAAVERRAAIEAARKEPGQ